MSDTRYLILLPLKFPEGQPVPAEYITETQIELARRFSGATLEPGRVSGMWVDEGQLVEDELVVKNDSRRRPNQSPLWLWRRTATSRFPIRRSHRTD